ncbi:DUF2285 domain-containing protein [uncultured Bartonella sp.]|uniref:DUF2285 domain-containing protein n=1 Tax=uncultured Bartonella sp. TaxID=104108 RepID=UPI00260621D2|nr:DUF2285 domain-containing protein [uncultured Bartonella sp.]
MSTNEQALFWSSYLDSRVIPIKRANRLSENTAPIYINSKHIRFALKRGALQFLIFNHQSYAIRAIYEGAGSCFNVPLVVPLIITGDTSSKLIALGDLIQFLKGQKSQRTKNDLTKQQRVRLIRMLRILDGLEHKPTLREIARVIFGDSFADDDDWKNSSTKMKTMQLKRESLQMLNGGYKSLISRL